MQTLSEPGRSTPVCEECDICVIGGSCTGTFAAIAAARLGARVSLVEALGYFGATATASMVAIWHSMFDTVGQLQIFSGLTLEAVGRLKKRNEVVEMGASHDRGFVFQPAGLAIELDQMVMDAGIRPFLHTRFVDAVKDGDGRVLAVLIEDKTGRRAIRARFFIDATGDADVATRLGLKTYKHEKLQPPTACAAFTGVPVERDGEIINSMRKTVFDQSLPNALRPGFLWGGALPDSHTLLVAGTRVHGADCSDADHLTRAEIEGRRQIRAIQDIARQWIPGCEGASLIAIPSRIGIRQTRQVTCLHQLSEFEVLNGVRFPDAIANGSYRVDIHSSHDDGLVFRYLDGTEVTVFADGSQTKGRWRPEQEQDPTFYQIPYRSLVPRESKNILIAGRCLDADQGAFGAVRVMVNCNQTGQAAGVAAYLAVAAQIDAAQVPVGRLREVLASEGAVVI